ncbi:MAG: PEP-CTERM sorting domain-containing protein [Planctomycetales bacterium]|nr:PEP-CTERM sorting domain-containing protein [Planctomycetales bacterium]
MKRVTSAVHVCVMIVSATAASSAHADLILSLTVNQSGHLLDGATISSIAPGDFSWEISAGFNSSRRYAAVNAPWTTTIQNATGAGAAWNGTYSLDNGVGGLNTGRQPGIRWSGNVIATGALNSSGGSASAAWTDGTNRFFFSISGTDSFTLPNTGTPVSFANTNLSNVNFFRNDGIAPSFAANPSGTFSATVTAVPEPNSIACVGLIAGGHLLRRRRRSC